MDMHMIPLISHGHSLTRMFPQAHKYYGPSGEILIYQLDTFNNRLMALELNKLRSASQTRP